MQPRSFFDEQSRRQRQTHFFIALGIVWMAIMACLIVDAHASLFRQFNAQIPQATVRHWCLATSLAAVSLWGLVMLVLLTSASRVLPLLVGARVARGLDEQVLGNVAEEIGIAAGESPSDVRWYVLESPARNAFACGRSIRKGSIVVTRGLLDVLDRDELQAVVAHEFAHLRNGDAQCIVSALAFAWMVIGVSIAACLVVALAVALLVLAVMLVFKIGENEENATAGLVAVLVALGLFIVGLVYLAMYAIWLGVLLALVAIGVKAASSSISQSREYLADACSAQWTRNPLALASALVKVSGGAQMVNPKSSLVSPLWLENPSAPKPSKLIGRLLDFLLHTHPNMENRLALLRDMTGTMVLTEAQWLAVIQPTRWQRIKEWALPTVATILAIVVGTGLVLDLVK